MGARWSWHAICECGEEWSGFSGGSDDCPNCGYGVVREMACLEPFGDYGLEEPTGGCRVLCWPVLRGSRSKHPNV